MSDIVERLTRAADWAIAENDHFEPELGREAAAEITALRTERDKLRARLEVDHAYRIKDGEMVRVEADLPECCDGISCRDETIRLLEEGAKAVRAERDALKEKLAEAVEALKPFAEQAWTYDPPEGDDDQEAWNSRFRIGDLRRAAALLASLRTRRKEQTHENST